FFSNYAAAEYIGNVEFQKIFVDNNWCYVQVDDDVSNTCSYFRYRFKFNATTSQGKLMYSALLMSQALKKKIDLWYTASSAVGTNETNGCNPTSIAEAYAIAIQ
ncbi:MAG: hypothetical protein D3923_05085, partial [Candidatus Electrothrix sp. AR3]|nr:hypothetical protein [Candidatus Electrothrix sp. AR3]